MLCSRGRMEWEWGHKLLGDTLDEDMFILSIYTLIKIQICFS